MQPHPLMHPPPAPHQATGPVGGAARLGLVIVDDQAWSVRALADAVQQAWPQTAGAGVPDLNVLPLGETDPHDFDALLVLGVGAPAADSKAVIRLTDRIEETLTPAILLGCSDSPAIQALASENIILLPPTTSAATLACVLHTLVSRQPAVRRLQLELRASHVLQSGVTAEFDRLQEELLLAGHIQREFLPKTYPRLPGLEFEVYYRPAGFVSGDVYDIVRLDDHRAGFMLADAMGHGAAAALLTLFISAQLSLKHTFRDSWRIIPPADALAILNAAMCRARGGAARLATAICGAIDSRSSEVTLAAAGHPAPILITRDGARTLEVSGMLLGVMEDTDYEHATFQLEKGDVLVLYSDGIVAPPVDPTSLIPHLWRTFGPVATGSRSLAEAMAQVAAELDDTAGSLHTADDVTVLAIANCA